MYSMGFQFDLKKYTTRFKAVLQDYSWWIVLVSKIAPQANKLEIRCWSDEIEAIVTGQQFGRQLENMKQLSWYFKDQYPKRF